MKPISNIDFRYINKFDGALIYQKLETIVM